MSQPYALPYTLTDAQLLCALNYALEMVVEDCHYCVDEHRRLPLYAERLLAGAWHYAVTDTISDGSKQFLPW